MISIPEEFTTAPTVKDQSKAYMLVMVVNKVQTFCMSSDNLFNVKAHTYCMLGYYQ